MNAYSAKLALSSAVIRLMARGPVTTRVLFSDNDIWTAKDVFGMATAEAWLRELARPEFEPPTADTRWRLVSTEKVRVK